MLEQLGSLLAGFNPGNVPVPTAPNLPPQNWQGQMKNLLTPGQGLEQLVIGLDMFGRGLDKRAGGTGAGFGGAEMGQSMIANRAAKERQDQWNQLLSKLIGGMTPGTAPGGNSLKITPNEDGTHKLSYEATAGSGGGAGTEGAADLGSFWGNNMKNFPFY